MARQRMLDTARSRSRPGFRPGLTFALLCAFLLCLWLAGGASRADALGQVVVRGAAWAVLVMTVLLSPFPSFARYRAVAWLLTATVALALFQLVPLPPAWWHALPGREAFTSIAVLTGQSEPWRPLAIVPGAAINAAGSLVVPIAMLVLLAGLGEEERRRLPALLLAMVAASTFVGLVQFSGAGFDNPLINETRGEVSGAFANRNHFALFVAFGLLLAPVWAFAATEERRDGHRPGWRAPVAVGLVLLFALIILASGSRVGMALGILALGIGLALVQQPIRRTLRRYPGWVFPALVVGMVAMIAILVLVSVAADRAVSIDRAMTVSAERDMRSRGLPTVLSMVRAYFPWGSGLGGFDPLFRMHEPFALLKLTYFNHAHNDWLEIALDAGLPGLLLLVAAVLWWGWTSIRAWRAGGGVQHVLPRLGSTMLLFVFMASAFDYPGRTPLMMATVILAAVWLNDAQGRGDRALPRHDQHL